MTSTTTSAPVPYDVLEGAASGATVDEMVRITIDLVERLRELPTSTVREVIRETPPPSGDARGDALVAAAVAHVATERGLDIPSWTWAPDRTMIPFLWTSPLPSCRVRALVHGPAQFRIRGVMLDPSDLDRA